MQLEFFLILKHPKLSDGQPSKLQLVKKKKIGAGLVPPSGIFRFWPDELEKRHIYYT